MQCPDFVDENGQIDPEFLSKRKFKSVLVYDLFRGIEADWLAQAINSNFRNGDKKIDAISYSEGGIVDEKTLTPDRDSILDYVSDKNLFYTILTDSSQSFLVYFDQYRDFFLLCGTADFLKAAYPVSSDTVKFQFFENLELEAQRIPIPKKELVAVWEKYADFAL
jgi:hypothetical protein